MKILFIAYIMMFLSPKAQVGEAQIHFQAGNELYQQGLYMEALNKYQSALATGYASPELYYNLGNTYYKLDDIGHSILYLERARKLAPADPDIQFNLEMCNLRVVDKVLAPPPFIFNRIYNKIRDMYPLNHLGRLTLVFYAVFMLLLIAWILVRQLTVKRVLFYSLWIFLILLITLSAMFVDRLNRDLNHRYAIVMVEKMDIMSAPSLDATEVFVLHEGVKVRIIEQSGDFVKIELADGKIGWMKSAALDVI